MYFFFSHYLLNIMDKNYLKDSSNNFTIILFLGNLFENHRSYSYELDKYFLLIINL